MTMDIISSSLKVWRKMINNKTIRDLLYREEEKIINLLIKTNSQMQANH